MFWVIIQYCIVCFIAQIVPALVSWFPQSLISFCLLEIPYFLALKDVSGPQVFSQVQNRHFLMKPCFTVLGNDTQKSRSGHRCAYCCRDVTDSRLHRQSQEIKCIYQPMAHVCVTCVYIRVHLMSLSLIQRHSDHSNLFHHPSFAFAFECISHFLRCWLYQFTPQLYIF